MVNVEVVPVLDALFDEAKDNAICVSLNASISA